jgi:hypothetical protein
MEIFFSKFNNNSLSFSSVSVFHKKSLIFRYPSDGEERSKASGNVSDQDVVRQTGKMSKPRQQSRQSGVSGCTCQPSLGFFTR